MATVPTTTSVPHPLVLAPIPEDLSRTVEVRPGQGVAALASSTAAHADRVVYWQPESCRVVFADSALDAGRRADLQQRCRLIALLDSPFILPVQNHDLSGSPATVTLRRPGDSLLDRLPELTDQQRLEIAGSLIAMMRDAQRFALAHDQFDLQHVSLERGRSGRLHIQTDYLSLLATDASSDSPTAAAAGQRNQSNAGATTDDLQGLQSVLRALIEPLVHPGALATQGGLEGRRRVVMQKLLGRPTQECPEIHDWVEVLEPWIPSTAECIPPSDRDRFQDPSADDASDRTGVVAIQSIAGVLDSSHTDEVCVASATLPLGSHLGRFRIDAAIGEGGMGMVYRGTDLSNDETVAIKVLRPGQGDVVQAIRRFRKEARLLGEVQNNFVTRLYHVGDQDGIHYMAMEFVAGTNLKQWAAGKLPLPESDALALVADIARSLVDAHDLGIVHRDIKPENILLQHRGAETDRIQSFRVKLSDFGIARHIDQSASMEVTRAGSMLGTPRYMSPEQCKGRDDVRPPADVYSLGVTLFELLTGSPPFVADDPMRVAAMHCFDPPPPLNSGSNEVSESTARLVAKALAKDPDKRFADAADMLREIERLIRGEPADIEAHPKTPAGSDQQVWSKEVCWDMQSTPDQLWPFVSNTDRLNRALGLPAVKYESVHDADLGLRKFGSFRLAGIHIRWEEHPFEWLEGRRMGVLREFESGPFKWFMSIVTLEPFGTGTRLRHEVRIAARNLFGKVITKIEADWKGFRSLDRVYRRIDRSIQGQAIHRSSEDAFESPRALPGQAEMRLERLVDQVSGEGIDPALVAGIADYLRQTPPQPLAQIRPLRLAEELRADADATLDACLVAASKGMLQLRWEVMCPTCKVAAESFAGLSAIQAHTRCDACNVNFESNLAESIELVFQPHPEIKAVDQAQYCVGGPEHSPHVVAQFRIEPAERIEIELALRPGDYLLRSTRLPRSQLLRVKASGAPSQIDVRVLDFGGTGHVSTVRAGVQRVVLTNDDDRLHVVRVERTVSRGDCVTAAMVAALQRFRDLFPDQRLSSAGMITSQQTTLVATEIINVDELYETLGDADAYRLVRRYQEQLAEHVRRNGGTVVKTAGESTLSAFHRCEDAVRAALSFAQTCAVDSATMGRLGIGVHRGQTLIASENSQMDFFGSAVRAAVAIPQRAGHGLVISESVFADPTVVHLLPIQPSEINTTRVDLPGLPNQRLMKIPHEVITSLS